MFPVTIIHQFIEITRKNMYKYQRPSPDHFQFSASLKIIATTAPLRLPANYRIRCPGNWCMFQTKCNTENTDAQEKKYIPDNLSGVFPISPRNNAEEKVTLYNWTCPSRFL